MLKKQIKFVDFNGNPQVITAYFHLSEVEIVRLDVEYEGGLEAHIAGFDPESNPKAILDTFEKLITESYGVKSEDGLRFVKEVEGVRLSDNFMQSAAYNALFMELISDADKAADFFRSLVPTPAPKE